MGTPLTVGATFIRGIHTYHDSSDSDGFSIKDYRVARGHATSSVGGTSPSPVGKELRTLFLVIFLHPFPYLDYLYFYV